MDGKETASTESEASPQHLASHCPKNKPNLVAVSAGQVLALATRNTLRPTDSRSAPPASLNITPAVSSSASLAEPEDGLVKWLPCFFFYIFF